MTIWKGIWRKANPKLAHSLLVCDCTRRGDSALLIFLSPLHSRYVIAIDGVTRDPSPCTPQLCPVRPQVIEFRHSLSYYCAPFFYSLFVVC